MNVTPHQRVVEVFLAAANLTRPDRTAYLERTCGSDAGLRREVEDLLARDARPAALDTPALRADESAATAIPARIGRYEILSVLGEGGMGTVYRARQTRPERIVALKVLRTAVPSSALLRRFEFEAQILARLQHPGIAQIYDAGVAEEYGRHVPFLTMELIEGIALTEYATKHALDVRARLGLITKICDAVQHAHQRGVIHRDLKPGNILVVGIEGTGIEGLREGHRPGSSRSLNPLVPQSLRAQPKVLDFGVARTINSDAHATMDTANGQLIGTLSYMSPEQTTGDADSIDTRTDVYALGVILYELLTGRLPHELRDAPLSDATRIIRERDAALLGTLDRALRGDLETIVAKALEKDKERRYGSVADLGADIERYLRDEPILARPAGAAYRFRKYARRNRVFVGAVAAVLLALVLGVIGTTWQAIRATASESRATQLAQREAEAREAAEGAARKATEIQGFLQRMLTSAAQAEGRGVNFTVREALDAAAQRIDREFAAYPEIRTELQGTIGEGYTGLGLHAKAEPLLRASLETRQKLLGNDHPDLVRPLRELGLALRRQDKDEEAGRLLDRACTIAVATWGSGSPEAAGLQRSRGLLRIKQGDRSEGERLLEESIACRKLASGSLSKSDQIAQQVNLMSARFARSDFREGEAAAREALRLIDAAARRVDYALKTNVLNQLAGALERQKRFDEAIPLLREVVERQVHAVGEEQPRVQAAKARLAACLDEVGQREDAARVADEARAELESRPAESPTPHVAWRRLGQLYQRMRKTDAAESAYRRGATIADASAGVADAEALTSAQNLATLLMDAERIGEAEAVLREIVTIAERGAKADHWRVAVCRRMWGNCLVRQDRHGEAETQLLAAHARLAARFKSTDVRTRQTATDLAALYEKLGEEEKAAEFRIKSKPEPALQERTDDPNDL